MHFLRLGIAGMRGEVASALTPDLAIDYASALGTYLDGGKIVIGCDTRISSNMLINAVSAALQSCGCEVLNVGICSAPELHFIVPHTKADGGLLIGAGHHPSEWNAITPLSRDGSFFNCIQTQELLDVYHSRNYRLVTWDKIGTETNISNTYQNDYLDLICSHVDTDAISSSNFKIVMDFCNGSGSPLANQLAKNLGLKLITVNDELSGILPHNPEPRPRSSKQAQSIVKIVNADAGFVFNSDMSRVAIVTDTGETLPEEYTFPLVANHLLASTPEGTKVVTNFCTTRTLDQIVERHKGILIKTKAGQSYAIDKMIEEKAMLTGDGSGSVALSQSVQGFDGLLAVVLILEAMALQSQPLQSLVQDLPRHSIIKRKIPCRSSRAYSLIRQLEDQFPDATMNSEDGYRFDWKNGWFHLRAAATEPIIRMSVEWDTPEEAENKALQLRGMLEQVL